MKTKKIKKFKIYLQDMRRISIKVHDVPNENDIFIWNWKKKKWLKYDPT